MGRLPTDAFDLVVTLWSDSDTGLRRHQYQVDVGDVTVKVCGNIMDIMDTDIFDCDDDLSDLIGAEDASDFVADLPGDDAPGAVAGPPNGDDLDYDNILFASEDELHEFLHPLKNP